MSVCHGVQSFVMASRAPVFHACSVDLSWQTTVHACQRCPRAALTPSAAIAAIVTQSNMEGTTSRFCPAGVHMGKCLPAQDVYAEAWGTGHNVAPGIGMVPRQSQKFAEGSKNADASIPPPIIEPWVPPDLPLPTTVHSKASFSPTVPISVQSPLPDDSVSTPSVKSQNSTPKDEKEFIVSSKTPELIEKNTSESKKPTQGKEAETEISRPKTLQPEPSPPVDRTEVQKEDISISKSTEEVLPKVEKQTPTAISTERTNVSPTSAPSTTISSSILTPPSPEVVEKERPKTPKDDAPHSPPTLSPISPNKLLDSQDESKENVPKVSLPDTTVRVEGEKEKLENKKPLESEKVTMSLSDNKVSDKTPDAGTKPTVVLKPVQSSSKQVPQFYIPMGRSNLSASELSAKMEKIQAQILESLAAQPSSPPKKSGEEESNDAKSAETEPVPTEKPTVDTAVSLSQFELVTKACGCPLYWKRALFQAAGGDADSKSVPVSSVLAFWRRVLENCTDPASQFVYLLTKGKSQYLVPDDFWPIIQDVVDTHPSLNFLQAAPEFHARYVTTVVSRIFFCTNTSWSGRISLGELRRSNFLSVLASLETEEDINLVTQYFSYEHFYVIYCKFWELDTNHDLIISKSDLARHNNYAISERMIDRIFSGAVTRLTSFKEGTMSYSDFVWFLLAEEDKRHPRSIEYWFRCMDLDGDGVLSLYELEYFYSEQSARMEEMGIEPPTLEDCLCQCLDMVRPAIPDKIRLSDLKKCNLCPVFFDTFFNLPKYLQHEQRDPFSNLRDIEEGLTEVSDWDRYASDTYEMLIASESGGGGGGIEDGEDEDEEDEDIVTSSPVLSSTAAAEGSDKQAQANKEISSESSPAQSTPTAATEPTPAE
nr:serine:threonine protein phosphatase 2A [Hymenolepis microstoma]